MGKFIAFGDKAWSPFPPVGFVRDESVPPRPWRAGVLAHFYRRQPA